MSLLVNGVRVFTFEELYEYVHLFIYYGVFYPLCRTGNIALRPPLVDREL